MRRKLLLIGYVLMLCLQLACKNETINRFEEISANHTNILFSNNIKESDSLNYFTYPYLYMGGGTAIADFNNDGLQDLFFTGNMVFNKLYLNKGNLQFDDISRAAMIEGDTAKWYSGVSIIDINADGYLDIYLSVSGLGDDRSNELYINNKDLTFIESASQYGLDDNGNSVQTSFFDYDNDDDLDVFVTNYPITSFATSNMSYRFYMDNITDEKSDHFYRNDGNGVFINVTEEAGLLSFGLSLSASIADFNQDGWSDIYVSNDFSTPDYFYINNGDGTFTDHLKEITKQTSFYGMGSDAADFNNDGLIDLFQVDMSAADNRRSKANMASMNPGLFWGTVNYGFHYQYMYNSLQLNRGIVNELPIMSNVAWIEGVSSTDWSWAPLFADFDNDGWKDLFVANGTRKEINNRDFFKKNKEKIKAATNHELLKLSDSIPSEPIQNYIFKNVKGQRFEVYNQKWNVEFKGFSNGTSYGDLDNDGDLDLVVNNIDHEAILYQNNTTSLKNGNYLRVQIEGKPLNPQGIGTKVQLFIDGEQQLLQLQLSRGFQSSVEPFLHFGLGDASEIDSIHIIYHNQIVKKHYGVQANQLFKVNLNEKLLEVKIEVANSVSPLLKEQDSIFNKPIIHRENNFNDYAHQVLLPHKMSNFGPALAVGDVNKDGMEDFYMGGASGYKGMLYMQQEKGKFEPHDFQIEKDRIFEDIDAEFLDVDNDGDLDLYVVSGGNEFPANDSNYQDRLYINQEGKLTASEEILPVIRGSGSCVRPYDYDHDGDIDLFIGGRLDPRNYPFPGESYMLENKYNEGKLIFDLVTPKIAPDLIKLGMITDGLWTDFNNDGNIDLLLVGEWMGIHVFIQEDGVFKKRSDEYFDRNTTGWWFSLDEGDFDKDGDLDYVFGNLGLNYKYQAKPEESFDLYVSDFDGNDKSDIVLSYHNSGEEYPLRGRQCSSEQIPIIKIAYKDYNSFSTASMNDIFGKDNLEQSEHFQVESFASIFLENTGDGKFRTLDLPNEAQYAPINDIVIQDIDDDGNLDIAVIGNLYASEVETPRSDAGMGLVLLGNGTNQFKAVNTQKSGFIVSNDSKKAKKIELISGSAIIIANNQGPVQVFSFDR